MRARYCALGLLFTFACANAQESPTPQALAILFHFDQPYAERTLQETEREVKALIGEQAVQLEWHDRRDFEGKFTFANIVVLNFRGNCDPRSDSSFGGPIGSWLARMDVSDGVVLPFGEVNCGLMRTLMADGAPSAKLTDKTFGHALARVLAHELYHFLTQSTSHATQGLEKPAFSRFDLLLDGLRLDHQQLGNLSQSMLLR